MDPTLYTDPNFVMRLGKELQKRIGLLPVVEFHAFHLESQPGEIVRMLRVQPQSYSEIARIVRAARTMKLTVRACGERTGGDSTIYGTSSTVLIDCSQLGDTPRMEFVNLKRRGEQKETSGLRVLACVGLSELVQFQVSHQIEIAQSVETTSVWGTVVGAICATAPGIVGPGGAARGACLADEVICVRIVDCHGDLIQYSSDEELSAALSTLGSLGVVYDVTLRYNPITLSQVNFKFLKWRELLNLTNGILTSSLDTDEFTEIIYLPYNNYQTKELDSIEVIDWKAEEDEVILRTGKRLNQQVGPNAEGMLADDTNSRQLIYLIDQVFGPEPKEFINKIMKTPWLLGRAHHYLKCRFQPDPIVVQYTPWAINSLGKMADPLRVLRFTVETTTDLEEFVTAIRTILTVLQELAHGGDRGRRNYAINLGLRVHFTSSTKTGRMLGVGFEPTKDKTSKVVLANISLTGITSPGPSVLWTRAANYLTGKLLDAVPQSMPQWKTEWHEVEILKKKFREKLEIHAEPLKRLISIADRDGVFLNELLATILYPTPTFYQKLYQKQREDVIVHMLQSEKNAQCSWS